MGSEFRCLYCGEFLDIAGPIWSRFIPDTEFTVEDIEYAHVECRREAEPSPATDEGGGD